MKRLLLVTAVVLAFSLIVTGITLADNGEGEEAGAGEGDKASAGEIALLLAPLAAAATAIERLIEMVFDWYEGMVLSVGDLIGEGKGYLAFARDQVKVWKKTIADLRKNDNDGNPKKLTNEEKSLLAEAEDALDGAQRRVAEFLKTPPYTSWKRMISLAAGIVLGIVVAFVAKLRMLAMIAALFGGGGGTGTAGVLGEVTRGFDMFLTGLIIGTGSAPVHSLIGLLQNTKNAVDEARALWAGNANSEMAETYIALKEFLTEREDKERGMRRLRKEAGEEPEEVPPMSEVEMRRLINDRLGRF